MCASHSIHCFFAGKYFENSQAFIVLVVVASTSIYFHICSQVMLYCVWFFARSMPPKPVPWVIQQLFMSLISIIAGDLFHSTSYIRSALISFGFSIFSSLFSAVAFSWIFVDAISMRYHCCLHVASCWWRISLSMPAYCLFPRRSSSTFVLFSLSFYLFAVAGLCFCHCYGFGCCCCCQRFFLWPLSLLPCYFVFVTIFPDATNAEHIICWCCSSTC